MKASYERCEGAVGEAELRLLLLRERKKLETVTFVAWVLAVEMIVIMVGMNMAIDLVSR